MKIPVVGTVRPSGQSLAYLRPAQSDTGGFARGLANIGKAVGEFAEARQARTEKVERFGALNELSRFETEMNAQVTEFKRASPPDAKGFVEQIDSFYNKAESDFIAKRVPAPLQDEFRSRTQQLRQGILGDSLSFQYKQQDAFFRAGIEEQYERSKVGLAESPDEYESYALRMAEFIDTNDLPQAERDELKKNIRNGLAAIVYGRKAEEVVRDSGGTSFVDKIIGVESSGNATAKNPRSSATGAGQFIESTWASFIQDAHPELVAQGDIQKLRNDPVLSREAVQWYANQNSAQLAGAGIAATQGSLYLAHFAGPAGAIKLHKANPTDSAENVLGAAVVNANPFLRGKNAADVIAWANKKMGGGDEIEELDSDPLFDGLTIEDREAMKADAVRKVTGEEDAAEKAHKEQEDELRNNLYNSLLDGTSGQAAIQAAYKAGWLNDVDDREKALAIIAKREEESDSAAEFQRIVTGEEPYNVEVHEKSFDNWVGKEGRAAIAGGNQDYINTTLLPAVDKVQDISSNVISQFETLSRSSDPAQVDYAYQNLMELQARAPEAFRARTKEDLAVNTDLFRVMQGTMNPEEIAAALRGGRNPAEISASNLLDKQAGAYMASKEFTPLEDVRNLFNGWGNLAPREDDWTAKSAELIQERTALFRQGFRATGDAAKANEFADFRMQATWGMSYIGQEKGTWFGGGSLIKHPPEMIYPKLNPELVDLGVVKSYQDQLRDDLNLLEDERVELVSDTQTQRERRAYEGKTRTELPSYGVRRHYANGSTAILPDRWYGSATPEAQAVPGKQSALEPPRVNGMERLMALENQFAALSADRSAAVEVVGRDERGRPQTIRRGDRDMKVEYDEMGRPTRVG